MSDFDWMFRVTVDDEPAGDPQVTDLFVLPGGVAYFDRLVEASGDPLVVRTAAHSDLQKAQVLSVRLGAISSGAATSAVIVLNSGAKLDCEILAADEKTLKIRDANGSERTIAREDVVRFDFK